MMNGTRSSKKENIFSHRSIGWNLVKQKLTAYDLLKSKVFIHSFNHSVNIYLAPVQGNVDSMEVDAMLSLLKQLIF